MIYKIPRQIWVQKFLFNLYTHFTPCVSTIIFFQTFQEKDVSNILGFYVHFSRVHFTLILIIITKSYVKWNIKVS